MNFNSRAQLNFNQWLPSNIKRTRNLIGLKHVKHSDGAQALRLLLRGATLCPRSGEAAVHCWSSREEIPHIQGKRTQVRWQMLREGIRGQIDWNHSHRQLANLITWTTALSNLMKLSYAVWGHLRRGGHGGEVWQNVAHWRREWQTTLVFLP